MKARNANREKRSNILITGVPGVGKTTLMIKLSRQFEDSHPVGFYTEEIKEKGRRTGFELVSLDGRRRLLSHTDIAGPYRVGRYGVEIRGFEAFLDLVPFLEPASGPIMIDEIGKMESFSEKFRRLLIQVLDSEKRLIATIALKGGKFISEIKERGDILLFELTRQNRDSLPFEILEYVTKKG
jgi:nucleoside-triphosphatase